MSEMATATARSARQYVEDEIQSLTPVELVVKTLD